MVNYQYIARDAAGQEVAGVMQADNEAAVVRTLDERKLFPVRVAEQAVVRRGLMLRKRIRLRDVGVMYGQLADLLRAGVPMVRSLETIARSSANRRLGEIVLKVRDAISQGQTFADALAAHPQVFPVLHSAMARAGERGGFIEDVLTNLSDFLDRQDELQSKVRGAMIYPLVLVSLGVIVTLFSLVVLVPRFKPMFHGIPLPTPTTILFALSDLFMEQWHVLISLLVLAGLGVTAFLRSDFGRQAWARWRLKIPIFGPAVTMVSITRFCRILGTMLANGVPILQALGIAKDATGNVVLAGSIEKATENVRAGEPLNQPLRQSGMFPAEIMEMIAVAEEANQLEKVLLQIASTVERRTNRQVDQAVRLIEPLILVVIAGCIAFVAVGLMYPIFTMSRMLRR
jgi:general secretion pathway protein F/type IV pilus assembly protein PilC